MQHLYLISIHNYTTLLITKGIKILFLREHPSTPLRSACRRPNNNSNESYFQESHN